MTVMRDIPMPAEIIARTMDLPSVFTLTLGFDNAQDQMPFHFNAGQFNMLSLFGIGEIPISINTDPEQPEVLQHTIRIVGRVTEAMSRLKPGDHIGLRGPFGRGWPVDQLDDRDVLVVTGGLGCAPVQPVIRKIMHERDRYGRIAIVQGVKHSDDLMWRDRYDFWASQPRTQVLLAAEVANPNWLGFTGRVTVLLERLELDLTNTVTVMCGPEPMMIAAARYLIDAGMDPSTIWISMERSMHCAVGHCGHCQLGEHFICRDGPVFRYSDIGPRLGIRGL